MSQYNPVTPTIKGQAMIAESLKTKTGLVFTKVEWGDGIVSRGEQYSTFTALKNKVIESPISKMERQDATLYITSVVNNSTLSTGFYCREIGVWAKIGANGTEQLFAYTYAENASYTPSSNQYNEKRIRIGLGVDANVNVTIKFNSEVYLTRQELEDHNTDQTAHPDIRQKLNSYLPLAGGTVTGTLNVQTQDATDNSTKAANTAFVQSAVYKLVNSAPATLDTLNELATALGNDPNFATTVSNKIGTIDAKADTNASNITALQTSDNDKFKTATVSNATITLTKGTGATTSLTVNNVANATYSTHTRDIYYDLGRFASKTIADLRTAIMNAAIAIGSGSTAYLRFVGKFSDITSGWGTTTATIADGGIVTVRISNIAIFGANYFHGTIYTYDVPEYVFCVFNGVWSALNRNLVQSDYDTLNSSITTTNKTVDDKIALHNTDATAHGNIINAHNADVNAHNPITAMIAKILGATDWQENPVSNLKDIKNLLGFGGIVAQRLDTNGYIKFANGFTIQWGYDNTSSSTVPLWVNYPIAFTSKPTVVASIVGNWNDSIVVSDISNTGFARFSHQSFNSNIRVIRPCCWIAIGF